MSEFELNPEVDQRLRLSIENQGDFLTDLGFAMTLLTDEVIAPNPLFSVTVGDHTVLPIFTTESDWHIFLTDLENPPAEVVWNSVSLNAFWEALLETPIDTIGFNLKTAEDVVTGNLFYFDKMKLHDFLETSSKLVNAVMGEENQVAEKLEKNYFVPVLVASRMYGDILRIFSPLKAPDGKEYIPIFDNLESLSFWYRNPNLIQPFKKNNGQIKAMNLSEILHPSLGENQFGNALGFVINPMEVNPEEESDAFLLWEDLKEL